MPHSIVEGRFTVPFAVLGLPEGQSPPRRFVLQVCTQDDVDRISGGEVRFADTFHYDDSAEDASAPHRSAKGTVAGGLFCERIFGPLPRAVDPLRALDPRSDEPLVSRPQAGLFGCVELREPIPSPWLVRFAPPGTPAVQLVRIPVLPPAMRPAFSDGSRMLTSDLNDLYRVVVNRKRRLARLVELGAPEIIIDNERRMLEDALFALLVDGVTVFPAEPMEGDDDPAPEERVSDPEEIAGRLEMGEEPRRRVLSLHQHMLQREPARFFRWLDAELKDNPRVLSAEKWPHDVHLWRAYLEAACLEIVPLREDGSPDSELLERTRIDRGVQITHKVHDLLFEERLGVLHVPEDTPPHVDVFAYREGGDVLLLTGTAASQAGKRRVFACLLTDATDEAARVAAMRKLWRLARYSASSTRELGVGHNIDLEEPLVPGSLLTGFVLLDGAQQRFGSTLRDLLPHHPEILIAVGATQQELAHARAHGPSALAEAAARTLRGKTSVGRTVDVV
jgi:hypothetical protein